MEYIIIKTLNFVNVLKYGFIKKSYFFDEYLYKKLDEIICLILT